MPARLPRIIREGVIDSWISGDYARVTAMKNGISEGSVVNIVDDYREAIGPERADSLRRPISPWTNVLKDIDWQRSCKSWE